ncbi:sensor histidine kinase [Actinoallomurus rhizosphaericola]|uniref:sensor histidine kinase n=1 Tax=Actinoallomurus rhizosphaericola TaxID=2952536 RepID=UPI002092FA59|nr:GAF domain-containing protein [Actinoallomurus rhizosphaericola]MCO5996751.1 GAF domain-containing protein [Actinoallomurus rhizosphaericola]
MPSDIRSGQDGSGLLPQLRLDELLAELQTRLAAVLTTRDRVHALVEAVVTIESDLDLDIVLRRIVEAAATLAGARRCSLRVIGEDDRLGRLVTAGEPGDPRADPPTGRSLSVPVRVRDAVFGTLELAGRKDDGEFDENDENIVTALAVAAGVAIENARLYEEARGRERWLQASADVSASLLSGTEPDEVLVLVAERARQVCSAATAGVLLATGDELVAEATAGRHADALRGMRLRVDGTVAGRVYRSGRSVVLADADEFLRAAGIRLPDAIGPVLIVPLGSGPAARGVLSVCDPPGGPALGRSARRLLEAFAAQAAVALELADRRRDAERLVLLEERGRIAKDLHDTVIQRLFATAMTLMGAARAAERHDVAVRVRRAVDDLDDTIRQIRSTIFALQVAPDERALRSRIRRVTDRAEEMLGFAPEVRLDGPLDLTVDDGVAAQVTSVLAEALSNAARHAKAHRVSVTVSAADDVVVRVADDGIGISPGGRRSGLRNLAERAERLGGSFHVGPGERGGSVLEWRVPAHASPEKEP